MKLNEWIQIWRETYKVPFLRPLGLECLKYCLNHIIPALGDREMSDLKGYEIQQFLNGLNDKPNMQHKVKVYLNEILEYAYRNRLIDFNPVLAIKMRIPKQKHRRALTERETDRFIRSLDGKPYRLLFLTYLYTGARRNEIIKETVKINFKKGTILLNGTKTDNAYRLIPLFDVLRRELEGVDYQSYFLSFNPDYATKLMRKHCDRFGFKDISIASLRTTFGTRCAEYGINPKTIQMWLGHSDVKLTMNTYVDGRVLIVGVSKFTQSEIVKFNAKNHEKKT
ncbi:MAG: site-specific integrase [Clostridiales bacterium]|jgi:integrase|nr:site-specific integrase [Clostridiales bacterium]